MLNGPHRRLNPLTGEWVLVSAGRTNRPWQGATSRGSAETLPPYDPHCYLCPGNERAGSAINPDYHTTFVFTNDFAALRPDSGTAEWTDGPLFTAHGEEGTSRVLCFSPRHDLTMARMTPAEIAIVIDLWVEQLEELGPEHAWVQIFENRGEEMGASNPHPHGQIWAGSIIPREPATEDAHQRVHHETHGTNLLGDYAQAESGGERIVHENDEWLVIVPFWAVWPFETIVIPRRNTARLTEIDTRQRDALGDALEGLVVRYDNLFQHPFPYSMGWHGAPFGSDGRHWTVHAHFYPPLLRSPTVRKFMVGYELLCEAQRDITAEEAAGRLRELSAAHYSMS